MNDFLTLSEYAKKINSCPVTARRILVSGDGPRYLKAGRRYLIPILAYQEWVSAHAS